MIRLFPSNANTFTTNGLGVLSDALSCTVTEELNGIFELEITYPMDGIHYKEIGNRRIIVVEPNPFTQPQAFRIYRSGRPINGTVTFNAEHISYDLTGYPVRPFSSNNVSGSLQMLGTNCVVANCPFSFGTDKGTVAEFVVDNPSSIRSLLAGSDNTIQGIYGGEFEFDNYEVFLHGERGSDRGVTIAYGKNMMDLNEEMSTDSVYSHVYPYWFRDEVGLVEVPGYFMSTGLELDVPKIKVVDFSSYLEQPENYQSQTPWKPTSSQLRTACQKWIEDNKEDLIIPSSNINVSFVQLAQSEEYKNYAPLQRVHLGDTVKVTYPDLGVDASAKCIKTVYNPIMEKYDSIELGEAQTNLITEVSDSMNGYNDVVDRSKTEMQLAIDKATKLITGGLGGNVILHSSDPNSKYPDEILIMDTDDINTAKKVWRWNSGGLGYSSTGYEGPYGLAVTMDGQIVGDYIAANTISGSQIKAHTITAQQLSNEYTDGITKNFAKIDLSLGEIESTVESKTDAGDVRSIISQNADSIRMKANKIAWQSNRSSMTENGQLRAREMWVDYGMEIYSDNANPGESYIDFHHVPYESAHLDYVLRLCYEDSYMNIKGFSVSTSTSGKWENGYLRVGNIAYSKLYESSDRRLKYDIRDLSFEEARKTILKLKPRVYRHIYNTQNNKVDHGLIYQEVKEAVDPLWNATDEISEAKSGKKLTSGVVNYRQFIPDLIAMVQYQDQKIQELEKRLDELERRLSDENS